MIIVIEGPDGAGKTYLVNSVVDEARLRGIDTKVSHAAGAGTYSGYLDVLQSGSFGQLVVADRLHYGELVYGVTRRQYPNISLQQAIYLDEIIDALGGKIVVLAPPIRVLYDRHVARHEDPPTYLDKELDRFKFLARMAQYALPHLVEIRTEEKLPAILAAQRLVSEVTR